MASVVWGISEVVPVSNSDHISHSKLGNLKSGHLSHWKLGNFTKKEKDRGFGSCSLSMNHHLQTSLKAALEVWCWSGLGARVSALVSLSENGKKETWESRKRFEKFESIRVCSALPLLPHHECVCVPGSPGLSVWVWAHACHHTCEDRLTCQACLHLVWGSVSCSCIWQASWPMSFWSSPSSVSQLATNVLELEIPGVVHGFKWVLGLKPRLSPLLSRGLVHWAFSSVLELFRSPSLDSYSP